MRANIWLMHFTKILKADYQKRYPKGKKWTDSEWTAYLRGILDLVAKKLGCYVARQRPDDKETSTEYLNIDAIFFDDTEYVFADDKDYDPFVIPRAVIELDNGYNKRKISYCLWKLLCVRAPLRILICYQSDAKKVDELKNHLTALIWQGSLMKGTDGDLLVMIGDEKKGNTDCEWGEYYSVFEWKADKLEQIETPDW